MPLTPRRCRHKPATRPTTALRRCIPSPLLSNEPGIFSPDLNLPSSVHPDRVTAYRNSLALTTAPAILFQGNKPVLASVLESMIAKLCWLAAIVVLASPFVHPFGPVRQQLSPGLLPGVESAGPSAIPLFERACQAEKLLKNALNP